MIDVVFVLRHLGGVARGTTLQAFGCSRSRLTAECAKGRIRRVRPGVFASAEAPEEVITAAAHGGALTCGSALRARNVWTLEAPTEVHVWMGLGGRRHHAQPCECVAHFTPGRMDVGIAPIEVALVHAFACYGAEFFFAAFESAWNKRMLSATARAIIRASLPVSARWLVDLARHDAESGLESLVRLRLHLMGIEVRAQVTVAGVGRVDFIIEERVILEADGRENHEGAVHRHRDLMRDATASDLGFETLRFDYAMILHSWDVVAAAILAALARARA
ncbi:endonuclease domain-containing protein [Microbacterium sp. NPDC090218]